MLPEAAIIGNTICLKDYILLYAWTWCQGINKSLKITQHTGRYRIQKLPNTLVSKCNTSLFINIVTSFMDIYVYKTVLVPVQFLVEPV
jgi:hypothetical protein